RSIQSTEGVLIDGPSLSVDHLLARSAAADVATLDARIGGQVAWDPANPLVLSVTAVNDQHPLYRSARVGLSLKRLKASPEPPRFIMRPYRYLTEPRRVSKGKIYL